MPKQADKTETQILLEAPSTSVERVPASPGPHRLNCGAVLTTGFIHYLTDFWLANHQDHPGLTLAFDYVACIEGPRAGESWHKLSWLPPRAATGTEQFQIGTVPCIISRRTQKGIKSKTIDVIDGLIHVD